MSVVGKLGYTVVRAQALLCCGFGYWMTTGSDNKDTCNKALGDCE